jgi:hypothetical protein
MLLKNLNFMETQNTKTAPAPVKAAEPTPKTLTNTSIAEVKQAVPDVKVVGNGDLFKVLCKASSKAEGWMKSTKGMWIKDAGVILQVTTQQGGQIAEALTFVPHVKMEEDVNGGFKLVSM